MVHRKPKLFIINGCERQNRMEKSVANIQERDLEEKMEAAVTNHH
jgi:hypothetical protein